MLMPAVVMMVSSAPDAPQDPRMNTVHTPQPNEVMHVRFINGLGAPLRICWVSEQSSLVDELCFEVAMYHFQDMHSSVHHKWSIEEKGQDGAYARVGIFQIVGGQHMYELSRYIENYDFYVNVSKDEERERDIVRVKRPPACKNQGGFDCQGPSVSDAIRRAVFRNKNAALCFCGDYNYSTTFTFEMANHEIPLIMTGDRCDCQNHAVHDMFLGCNWDTKDPALLEAHIDCDALMETKYQEELRMFVIHATAHIDKLSMKHKLWSALESVYGAEVAQLVMPLNYNFIDNPQGIQKFLSYCDQVIKDGQAEQQFIILVCYRKLFVAAQYYLLKTL
jgi:hypothetical protein